MKLLELTLETPAENLALDEALLEQAEGGGRPRETLRLWESPQPFVVLGRSSRVADEVDRLQCQQQGLPILRRPSGGASVVAGPGCLMYAVVLSYEMRPQLQMITEAHRHVMQVLVSALRPVVPDVAYRGTSDLALGDRKFSGNSLRCKRTHLLYHGTILYRFPLSLIATCLKTPPRQPDYREGRHHEDFVTNLPADPDRLRRALIEGWNVDGPLDDWPRQLMASLAESRYRQASWNFRL